MSRQLYTILTCLLLLSYSNGTPAWSGPVHNAIGMLAIGRLQDDTRDQLEGLVGVLDEESIGRACNWPDVIREKAQWEWSKPLHYINIPRGDFSYQASRDCPDGRCATEAIKHYAGELSKPVNTRQVRWQAFAWLCHLVADLHQPMHAGFADDRGGNDYEVVVRGETINLHYFWDHVVVMAHADDWRELSRLVQASPAPSLKPGWVPDDVNEWTNESHELAKLSAYPPSREISATWGQQSLQIAVERINLAAARLALVVESMVND